MEPITVWTISSDNLQTFYQEVKYRERFGRLGIKLVFNNVIGQVISLYTDKAEVRYEKFIKAYFDIAHRIPQYYIASYVGVKPQSLSRIRKRICCFMIEYGSIELYIDFKPVLVNKTFLLVSHPGQVHQFITDKKCKGRIL